MPAPVDGGVLVRRRAGGLEVSDQLNLFVVVVRRRAGGLEEGLRRGARVNAVRRRAGGLEVTLNGVPIGWDVRRRAGGLAVQFHWKPETAPDRQPLQYQDDPKPSKTPGKNAPTLSTEPPGSFVNGVAVAPSTYPGRTSYPRRVTF